jgi:protein TonB
MLRIRQGRAALGLVVGTLLGVVVLAEETGFAARLNEARQAVLSGAGKDYYDGAFTKAFHARSKALLERVMECRKRTRDTEPPIFDMLLKLAGDGHVETAMVRPDSKTATCYLERAKKDAFPKPPSAGFWVEIAVNIRIGKQEANEVPLPPPTRPTHLLIASLSSADPSVRSAAAWQLAGARELQAEARAALEPLRADADRGVRYAAAWALGHLPSPSDVVTTTGQTNPNPIKILRPEYPKAAFTAKIEGTVVVDLLIGEQGEVAHLEIRQSIPELDAAAIACVRRWTFEPGRVSGVPRAVIAHAPVAFRIY